MQTMTRREGTVASFGEEELEIVESDLIEFAASVLNSSLPLEEEDDEDRGGEKYVSESDDDDDDIREEEEEKCEDDDSSESSGLAEYDDSREEEEEKYEDDDDDDDCSESSGLADDASVLDVFGKRGRRGKGHSLKRALIRLDADDDQLRELVVHCDTMTPEIASEFALHLPRSSHLRKLRLSCGGEKGGTTTTTTTTTSAAALREIVVSGLFGRRALREIVVSGLYENKSINDLEIRGAIVDRESSGWLVPSFGRDGKLERICMTECAFVGCGLASLIVAMQHNKGGVRQLEFRGCMWDEHNADIVATCLPYMTGLRSLALVDVNIAADAWTHLFGNVERASNLNSLDLSGNRLDEISASSLASAMSAGSISSLTLSRCDLDDRTTRALASGLCGNVKLTALDLSRNGALTDASTLYLLKLLGANQSITVMNVDGCDLGARSTNAIRDRLRYNGSFVKAFFSEATSKVIFSVVDVIHQAEKEVLVPSLMEFLELPPELNT